MDASSALAATLTSHTHAGLSHRGTAPVVARCRVHHVGLSVREALVIESVFRTYPELHRHLAYGTSTAEEPAHILFVNADNEVALARWEQFQLARPRAQGILVTGEPSRFSGRRTVAGPLCFRNCSTIVEALSSAGNAYFTGQHDSNGDAVTITAANEEPAPTRPQANALPVLRVLVVDDCAANRELLRRKLVDLARTTVPLHIDCTDSGEHALLAEQKRHYDLVFVDGMPGMDGTEVCRRLKALGPARVALLTDHRNAEDFRAGKAAGCDNFLDMPPTDTDLRTVLLLTALGKIH